MKRTGITQLKFLLRKESFCVNRLPPDCPMDLAVLGSVPWFSITRTEEELSVVAPEDIELGPGEREPGWSCMRIAGILDFALVGVIAEVSRILANAGVGIFTLSTFNTDYILVKSVDIKIAVRALIDAGHVVISN